MTFDIDVDRDAALACSRNSRVGGWSQITKALASVWHTQHDLQLLKIVIKDSKEPSSMGGLVRGFWTSRGADARDAYVSSICWPLRAVSPVKRVVIEGNMSASYANELKTQMEGERREQHRLVLELIRLTNRPLEEIRLITEP